MNTFRKSSLKRNPYATLVKKFRAKVVRNKKKYDRKRIAKERKDYD